MKILPIAVITGLLSCSKQQDIITAHSQELSAATITATGEIVSRCFTGGMLTGTVNIHGVLANNVLFIYSILGVDTISRMQLSAVNGVQDFTLSQGEGGYCDNLPKLKLIVYSGGHKKLLDKRVSTCKTCK